MFHLYFLHKKQDRVHDVKEEQLHVLNKEFHKNADQSIRDIRKLNKVLSQTVIVKIHKASHVR